MTTIELKERIATLSTTGLPHVMILSFLFGTSTIASRFILAEMNSISFIGLRMAISVLCFVALFAFSKNHSLPRDPKVWKHGMVLGIIGTTLPMTGFITSLNYLSAGLTSIISTVGPALTVTMAHFLLKDDKLDRKQALGVILALGGALMLIMKGESGLGEGVKADPIGYFFILGSTVSSSISVIYTRRFVREMKATEVTSVRALTAMMITLPLGIFVFGYDFAQVSPATWGLILYGSIASTFFGFILSLLVINEFGVTTSIITNYLVPIVATITGALLLHEIVTGGMIFGMLVILSGIYIINAKPRKSRQIPAEPKY
ncbi:MAG: DMT family transporter [Anaerolineales bacterium]|nr:DMT family transporter [Anaerolineales bacterium]MCB0005862.1 DMT family transporter [Anaerolineales bacterium]MCB0017852.1 DMT family transporter [Anaerolineales bacterium]MCB0027808.1 DMT family transporter [Anaerolineales bacterium]MCB8960093.1 DMT family transporter [Ardenticatenales bacterium]